MGTVIAPETMSTTIIIDIFRDGLIADAANPLTPLEDFGADSRPSKSKFVVTSFPKRGVYYPLIVVSEQSAPGGRIDRRADLQEYDYSVKVEIFAQTNTHLYKMRDAIRAWYQNNYEAIQTAGFTDPSVGTPVPTSWDSTAEIKSMYIPFTGKVYTG